MNLKRRGGSRRCGRWLSERPVWTAVGSPQRDAVLHRKKPVIHRRGVWRARVSLKTGGQTRLGYNGAMTERRTLSEFVGCQADEIRRAWASLPAGSHSDLGKALGLLPTAMKSWRGLIGEAMEHLRSAAGDKHRVVIVGPANSGKSTLYNTLIRSGKDRAEV